MSCEIKSDFTRPGLNYGLNSGLILPTTYVQVHCIAPYGDIQLSMNLWLGNVINVCNGIVKHF